MLISNKSSFDVDALALNLVEWANIAASTPPAYLGAGITEPLVLPKIPIGSSSNPVLGRMMDGKGLMLNCDLKDLGIKKSLPKVYERTLARRIFDKLGDERGTITTYDGIVNARGSGNYMDTMWSKSSTTTTAVSWASLYRTSGMPAAGTYTAIPTGASLNNTNTSSLLLGVPNPSGSNVAYLASVGSIAAQQINMYQFVDLLVACGSISLTSASAQTVSSAALTRYTTGAGVYITLEVTTAAGSTAQNATVSYTNQATTSGKSTGAQGMAASAIVQRLVPTTGNPWMPLASGDYGVQAVASITMSAANSAGAVALNIAKPLMFMPGLVSNTYGERDTSIELSTLIPLAQESGGSLGCLVLYILPNTTSTGILSPVVRTIWG